MMPPPPDALDAIGRTEWIRVVGLLVERGQWDPLRSTVLLAYCVSYADWHRLTEQVRGKEVVLQGGTRKVDDQGHVTTEGGKAAPNPLLPVIDRAHRSLQVALEELLRPAPWALAPTPTPVTDGAQAEPSHPWLRHPDETAKAYAAFRYYRDLGAARSIRQVTQKLTVSDTLTKRWSTVHAWVIRVRAWDEHQDRIAVAVSTDAIQAMRLEHAGWGRVASVAAIETITAWMHGWRERGSVGEPPFTAYEAARLIQIGSALKRTARGLKPEGPGELSRRARRPTRRCRPRRRLGGGLCGGGRGPLGAAIESGVGQEKAAADATAAQVKEAEFLTFATQDYLAGINASAHFEVAEDQSGLADCRHCQGLWRGYSLYDGLSRGAQNYAVS